MKRVLKYIRKYTPALVLSLLLAGLTVLLTLYIPILTGNAVDLIIGKGQVDMAGIFAIMKKIAIAMIITAVGQWIMNTCNNYITYHVIRDIRTDAFAKLEILPLKYLDAHAYGDIVSRVIADVDTFADGLLMGFTQLFTGALTILCTLGFMLVTNVPITLVVVCITPVSFLVAKFIATKTYSMFKEQSETRGEQTSLIEEMIDNQTKGDTKVVKFYNPGHENDHIYVPAAKWNEEGGKFFEDVAAMCDMLSSRGLASADLLLGADTYNAVLDLEKVQRLLDKNSGIIVGQIEEQLSPYHGVVYGGTLNFKGHKLNLISVDETYVDDEGKVRPQFPKTDALVTAPGCGHLMYGAITQINYGDTKHTTIASRRVPKFSLNQENDLRKTILKARPLAAPHNYCPWIRVKNVVG